MISDFNSSFFSILMFFVHVIFFSLFFFLSFFSFLFFLFCLLTEISFFMHVIIFFSFLFSSSSFSRDLLITFWWCFFNVIYVHILTWFDFLCNCHYWLLFFKYKIASPYFLIIIIVHIKQSVIFDNVILIFFF